MRLGGVPMGFMKQDDVASMTVIASGFTERKPISSLMSAASGKARAAAALFVTNSVITMVKK
eukprot:CAMPEP_0171134506 /NCGR_PEP_ID=MMETSP0766_2-20121228/128102_1 /TAXON_ID=439317 /ORGANISM="Gambierdiscus australes, Strain CAWD 149" /LENGTH=61 /DNA_ID=CAMNT_0011597957 /DNA_START=171 /DNA_END=356 /DNA_ORIENTATION=-